MGKRIEKNDYGYEIKVTNKNKKSAEYMKGRDLLAALAVRQYGGEFAADDICRVFDVPPRALGLQPDPHRFDVENWRTDPL